MPLPSEPAGASVDTRQARLSSCPKCGAATLHCEEEESELCERCLFGLALDEPEEPSGSSAEVFENVQSTCGSVGDYELIEEIGRGGMGVVYKAHERGSTELVAIKMLLPGYRDDAEARTRFARETQAMAALEHPAVVPIRDVFLEAPAPFFVMDFASAGSLADLLPKYRGRWRQAVELMVQIAQGVQHAHEHGILHRDLKPGNILFNAEFEPLISDFGLAKWLDGSADGLTCTLTVFGTPHYVAPEQAKGGGQNLTSATDIYSLGAIFYELLTGQPPFVSDNPLAVLQQTISSNPAPLRSIERMLPQQLEAICLKCLEKDPTRRYPSAEIFADDLDAWLQGKKVSARPPVLRRLSPRQNGMVVCVVAACVVAAWIGTEKSRTTQRAKLPASVRQQPSIQPQPLLVFTNVLTQGAAPAAAQEQFERSLAQTLGNCAIMSAAWCSDPSVLLPGSGSPVHPLQAGSKAGVEAVAWETLRATDSHLRIVSRIVHCATGRTLWGQIDTIALHPSNEELSAVGTRVGRALIAHLGSRAERAAMPAYAPEAENLCRRAEEFYVRRNRADNANAIGLFEKALHLEPGYIQAQAGLAKALNANAYFDVPNGQWSKLAQAAATAALKADPFSASAHQALGDAFYFLARYPEALEQYLEVLELDPQSAGCTAFTGMCWREMGRPRKGLPWMLQAAAFDPTHGIFNGIVGETYMLTGDDLLAKQALQRFVDFDPDISDPRASLAILSLWERRWDDAKQMNAELKARFPDYRYRDELAAEIAFFAGDLPEALSLYTDLAARKTYRKNWGYFGAVNPASAAACVLLATGKTPQAQPLLREAMLMDEQLLSEYPGSSRILHDLAAVWSLMGQPDRAMESLRQAVAAGWVEHRSTMIDPRFRSLQTDGRFRELMAQTSPTEIH